MIFFALVIHLVRAEEGFFWSEDWNEHVHRMKKESGVLKANTEAEMPTPDGLPVEPTPEGLQGGYALGEGMQGPNGTEVDSGIFGAYSNPDAFKEWQYSVVRIDCVSKAMNIQQPYKSSFDMEDIGSGFMVRAPLPTVCDNTTDFCIVTNAHVVRSCQHTRVQLPALGRKMYDAEVPMICFNFDLAIVKLKNPQELIKDLESNEAEVKLLDLQITPSVEMGATVIALGFSLGSQYLKYSDGIISGGEDVNDWMVIQSTAPISPGNSGGPLLLPQQTVNGTTVKVIGVNFASSGSFVAQNLNYVVPALRVAQVIYQYHKYRCTFIESDPLLIENGLCSKETGFKAWWPDYPEDTLEEIGTFSTPPAKSKKPSHVTLRIPPIGIIATRTLPAQFALPNATGCTQGIQIDKIKVYSVFRSAEPVNAGDPYFQEGDFLVRVGKAWLDEFGMGRNVDYMQQYVSYRDLLTFQTRLDDPVSITTCRAGILTDHTLSLKWNTTKYQPAIRYIEEPEWDEKATDFEYFAGVTLMPMSLNHLYSAIRRGAAALGRYLPEAKRVQPRVCITHCGAAETCSGIFLGGMVVDKINGIQIQTLGDLRAHFKPQLCTPQSASTCKNKLWEIVTDRGVLLQVNFTEELIKTVAMAEEGEAFRLTPAVMANMHLVPGGTTTTTTPTPTTTIMNTTTTQAPAAAVEVGYEWVGLKGKTAIQSTTAHQGDSLFSADLGVDGNADDQLTGQSCTKTEWSHDPWWEVSLGDVVNISTVRLINRGDCCQGRLNGLAVYVDGENCARDVVVDPTDSVIEVPCHKEGEKVTVKLPGRSKSLSICEFMIKEKKLALPGQLDKLGLDNPESSLAGTSGTSWRYNKTDDTVQMKKSDLQNVYKELEGVADALGLSSISKVNITKDMKASLTKLEGALGLSLTRHSRAAKPSKSASLIEEDEVELEHGKVAKTLRSKTVTAARGALEIAADGRPHFGQRQTMRRN